MEGKEWISEMRVQQGHFKQNTRMTGVVKGFKQYLNPQAQINEIKYEVAPRLFD